MYLIEMYAFALYESRVCRNIHVYCNLKTLTTDRSSPERRPKPQSIPSTEENPRTNFPLPPKPSPEQLPHPRQNHPDSNPPAPHPKANTPNANHPPCRPHPTTRRPPAPPSNMHSFCGEHPPPASFRVPMRDPQLPNGDRTHRLRPQHHRLAMSIVYGGTERKRHAAFPARITTLAACFDGAHLGGV